jgi:Methyltransferase domain
MKKTDAKMPTPASKHIVKTLNKRGPVTTYIDEYTRKFIIDARHIKTPILELGAAYGIVTHKLLKTGATVIANDIDPQHLQILYNQTLKKYRTNLSLLEGTVPNILDLANDSIGACYVARMLGYLTPSKLQLTFEKIYSCLKPNAKFTILATTPYHGFFKKIVPIYEKRLQNHRKWPGYFTQLKSYFDPEYTTFIHDKLHFFDIPVLTRELAKVGFYVEFASTYARTDMPCHLQLDGREGIVVIARKPNYIIA